MTETQIDLMEIKQTLKTMQEDIEYIKKKENMMFDSWISQYDTVPVPLTQGCSFEQQMKSIKDWNDYMETK